MPEFSEIPKVDRLLSDARFQSLLQKYPYPLLIKSIRSVLDEIRSSIRNGSFKLGAASPEAVFEAVSFRLGRESQPNLRRVINATGTVIHTNLGRSPLPAEIASRMAEIATHYCNLEFDMASGERGDRYIHLEPLICELTGAEAALVVNNNAAALLLALSALARGKEVVVSRGELVEIGGSFRIPEIMEQSGAVLREVGTTNRTHLRDYKKALNTATALLLKVSCSNFAMIGFTAEVGVRELAALGGETGLPVVVDAGSGALLDLEPYLGCGETTVRKYIEDGADLVLFSGDKLLGASQVGIIAGKTHLVEYLKKHPLLRALRLDKTALAALEGVLRLYRDERTAFQNIPTLRMLTMSLPEIVKRSRRIIARIRRLAGTRVKIETVTGYSAVGGGALPALQLPTRLISVSIDGLSPELLENRLRMAQTPVVARISKGMLLLDPRTVLDDDVDLLARSLASVIPLQD